MKKYKLIQEYPGSPPIGTVLTKHDYTVGCIYYCSYITNNMLYVESKERVENQPKFWEEIPEISKEVLFITEDGVKIYEGDKFYPVCVKEGTGFLLWTFIPQRWDSLPEDKESFKYFFTKKAAKKFIYWNAPTYSKRDVDLFRNNGMYEYYIQSIDYMADKGITTLDIDDLYEIKNGLIKFDEV